MIRSHTMSSYYSNAMLSKPHPPPSNSLPRTFIANGKGTYTLQIQALISKDRYK